MPQRRSSRLSRPARGQGSSRKECQLPRARRRTAPRRYHTDRTLLREAVHLRRRSLAVGTPPSQAAALPLGPSLLPSSLSMAYQLETTWTGFIDAAHTALVCTTLSSTKVIRGGAGMALLLLPRCGSSGQGVTLARNVAYQ